MRRMLAMMFLAVALAACDEDAGTNPPPSPPGVPLTQGLWHMHKANDVDLPAEIARRFVGVVDEQTMLDSARLTVLSNGTWQQRYWLRVLHLGALDRDELVIDEGTWVVEETTNRFTSTLRARTFTVLASSSSLITSTEPMVFFPDPPDVIGVYRKFPPTPPTP